MPRISWSIESSIDKDYIFARAIILGWLDNPPKVQVKKYEASETWYVIEPYEEECNCPNLIPPVGYYLGEDKQGDLL